MIQNPNNPTIIGTLEIIYDYGNYGIFATTEEVFSLVDALPNNASCHHQARVLLTGEASSYTGRSIIFPVVDCPEVTQ